MTARELQPEVFPERRIEVRANPALVTEPDVSAEEAFIEEAE